jgi:phage replication-related protein YjqB (UPF0714/DUF867 family)
MNHRRTMMPDVYSDFRELQMHEKEGVDYRRIVSPSWNPVLIIAPHGGEIEPYTSEIAKWIAGPDFAYYSFEGIKRNNLDTGRLHITSHNFDEPTLQQALKQAYLVLTIHGLKNSTG